jgi:aspartate kinase
MRVLKFGGTSVWDLSRVLEIVQKYYHEGLCIVVSAVKNTTALIRNKNIRAVRNLFIEWARDYDLRPTIEQFWDHAEHLCRTKFTSNDKQQEDLLLSYGERMTAYIIDKIIHQTLGSSTFCDNIQVHGPFGDAIIAGITPRYPNPGTVLVVPGFYGYDRQVVKTIGVSGSDVTAGAMATVLNATEVVIYTDVKGIYTADPRIVPEATLLPEMTRWDAIELGYAGGNVLHPRTVSQLFDTDIVLWVRHLQGGEGTGTKVHDNVSACCTAVALRDNQILVTVEGQHMCGIPGIASELFDTLAMQGVSVSLITQSCSECAISFAIAEEHVDAIHELSNVANIQRVSVITLVGSKMKARIGVAASLFSALANSNINVLAISQGSTERSISAVVARQNGSDGLIAVHHRM